MKWIAAIVVALVCAAVAIVLLSKAAFDYEASRVEAARDEQAGRLLPRYLALGRALDADPFFAAARPGGDAGPWLNPRVPWTGAPAGATPELALPADLAERVEGWGGQWTDHADEPALDQLDFGWMARLSAYGYWNLIPGGPLEHLVHLPAMNMPRPDGRTLSTWAGLRLLASKRRGDGAMASREVRQLAWLCYSTEDSALQTDALALLRIDRKAQLALSGPWTPCDEAFLKRAETVFEAAQGYTYPPLREDLFERARSVRAGRCAALGEAAWVVLMRRQVGMPLPPALAREYESPAPCRLELLRAWLERGELNFKVSEPRGVSRRYQLVAWLFPKSAERLAESSAGVLGSSALDAAPP